MSNRTSLPLLTAFLFLLFASSALAETITVRADVWPPFNGDPKGDLPGYGIEVLKVVFGKLGHTIDYQNIPWNRALADVRDGKFDAAIGASTEDGVGLIFPSESIGSSENTYFAKKDNAWRFTDMASLEKARIAVIDGYDYGNPELNKWIKEKGGTPQVQVMTGDDPLEKNIQKLMAGRVDAVVEAPPVMTWTLKKMGIASSEVIDVGKAAPASELFVVFSPKKASSKDYAEKLSAGIKALRASGELKSILAKYGLNDWK